MIELILNLIVLIVIIWCSLGLITALFMFITSPKSFDMVRLPSLIVLGGYSMFIFVLNFSLFLIWKLKKRMENARD